jgi:hypothetical protein
MYVNVFAYKWYVSAARKEHVDAVFLESKGVVDSVVPREAYYHPER